LIGHLPTIGREQNTDIVLDKKIKDHALQRGIILDEKNARLALFVLVNLYASNRRVAHLSNLFNDAAITAVALA